MHAIVMHSTQPWPANARASIDAAAARWRCDVRVFDFPYAPHPSWARLELAKHLRHYDRVLTLDPDIFISGDCPDIFALSPPTHVCMAPELQSREDHVGPYPWNGALAQWRRHLARRVSIKHHLQGGVCLYTPRLHWRIFEQMLGWWNMHGRFSHAPIYEQPLWHEVGERLFNLPIRRMSRLLNRHTRKHHDLPQHYIMHLTGGDKHQRIARTNWRDPAHEPRRIIENAAPADSALQANHTSILHACLFHERILVTGDTMQPAAGIAAHVTTGQVYWLTSSRDLSWCTGEAQGRVQLVQGDAQSLARRLHATLLIHPDSQGRPVARTLNNHPAPLPTHIHWWRSLSQTDTPFGALRARLLHFLRGS